LISYKGLSLIFIFSWLLLACQTENTKTEQIEAKYFPTDMPEDIWISEETADNLDSILSYGEQAHKKLLEKDTLGAEIYFDQAFEILASFSDEERSLLQNWPRYNSVCRRMNSQYEEIYLTANLPMEAEEIRQEIIKIEEISLADSVLNGANSLIDSSAGIPLTINPKVRLAIKYFQTKGRYVYTRWLERSGKYEGLLRDIFNELNLPEELIYLAMIESGFNPSARSYARAVGMWQFMSATGKHYGLRNNWWFDERRDVLKASRAAAEHLQDLYERFDDWYLALSGYNCNPRKVELNMRRYATRDFWKLKRLPRQTRNYVPTYLAATIIAREPEKFGFFVTKQKPFEADTVLISESIDLNVVAKLVDTTYAHIRELNPAVLRWVTPPGIKDFTIYIPKGTKDKFKQGFAKIPDTEKRSWVRHRIRAGESLSTISQKYRTSISVIKSTNKLRNNFIRAGKYLLIPVPQNKAAYYASKASYRPSKSKKRTPRTKIINVPGHKKVSYLVKRGDTLGEIAENYSTRASKIRQWNGLRYGEYIRPKQTLTLWVPENLQELKERVAKKPVKINSDPSIYYTVRTGDTLWDIAKKYDISITELKKLNKMRSSRIRPGDRLKVSKN